MDQSVATELAKLKDLLEMGFIGSHIPTLLCVCIFQKRKKRKLRSVKLTAVGLEYKSFLLQRPLLGRVGLSFLRLVLLGVCIVRWHFDV
jgi:hypothetical protein